jgi:CheY-like chemotaxis protein
MSLENSSEDHIALHQQADHVRQIEELASGVAHDFNNLIMAIQANTELVRLRNKDTSLVPLIDNILHGCQSGSTLARSLLGYAKKQVLVKTTFSVKKLLANVVPLCEAAHGPKYPVTVRQDQKLRIHACFYSLSHCLLNLLNNAVQSMPTGGRISIDVYKEEDFARIDVRDEGVGIKPEDLERIFEPFFTTKSSGTGMGLSMVRSVIEQHEGKIGVFSTVEQGTIISLLLPLAKENQTALVPLVLVKTGPLPQEGRLAPISTNLQTRKAIVLDDEQRITEALGEFLESLGFQTKVFHAPQEALDDLDPTAPPGLIITDYSLPQMNGIEFIRKAIQGNEAGWAGVKFILISGFPPTEFSDHAAQLPVKLHLLQKPFSFDTLKRLLLTPATAPDVDYQERTLTSRINSHPVPERNFKVKGR